MFHTLERVSVPHLVVTRTKSDFPLIDVGISAFTVDPGAAASTS